MNLELVESSAISEIPPDITFKFPRSDGGEIKANKTILAMVSKIFRNMFFISNTRDKYATEMIMEDTTKPAFQIMLDDIYNVRPVKESLKEKSVNEIFDVLYLVDKYEIYKLLTAVKEYLSSFPITEENVLEVASDAMEYSTTFEEAAQVLILACAKFLKTKVGDGESFIQFVAENGDQMETVHKLAVLMKDMRPFPTTSHWCDGCSMKPSECLDGQDVTRKNVKVGIRVIERQTSKVGIIMAKDEVSSDKDWIICWENNEETGGHYISNGGTFLFKCH